MLYSLEFDVRDYECDLQAIVNNANYQHYYEHTRHQFLVENNISFADLHDQGVELVVARIDLAYKLPLRSRDRFVSEITSVSREGVKYVFHQRICRLPDRKLCNTAKYVCVCLDHGKLSTNETLDHFCDMINTGKK